MLKTIGIEVQEATDGEEAIQAVLNRQAIDKMFRLIIMDVEMPIKNGWKAARELTDMKEAGTLPDL